MSYTVEMLYISYPPIINAVLVVISITSYNR